MKLLKCLLCEGELDIVGNFKSSHKKVKCKKCGYTNVDKTKDPEIYVIRKKS